MKTFFKRAITAFLLGSCLFPLASHGQRQMERLGRGMMALRASSTQVYIGWRLLGNDPEGIAFNLYRSGATAPLNGNTPLINTTDFTDTPPNLSTTAYTYSVQPVVGGVQVPDTWANPLSGPFTLPANATIRQYFPVPIQPTPDGALDVKFCWAGDLDGDGEYDFVIDRQPPGDTRQFLEAYKRDGTLLWRMDMGPNSTNHYNIEPGSSAISIGHGDNVTVYDLDGDGKAEVIVRTANGVVFGNGATLTDADNNKQFLSIVNGLTGVELAHALVPNARLSDGPMNGHMGIVYLDGQRPSVLLASKNRATDNSFHGSTTTWDYRNNLLTQRWSYNAETLNQHAPEAHQIRLGDPDNDGKDEYIDIGFGIDDNGLQLFTIPEVEHGDRFHMTDIDPDRPGLETYLIQQNNGTGLATALIESDTGKIIKKWYAAAVVDVGRGLAADIDPTRKGCELFSTQGGTFDSKGTQIYSDRPFPPEAIWWDSNLSREFLATVGSTSESPAIARFDTNNPANQSRIYTIYNEAGGCYWGYGGRPQLTADILGDWREEIVVAANDNSELRIYTTKNAATNRLYTLMHNPQYRIQTTTKGYVQSSYVDYYLGDEMTPPPPPPMVDAKLVWRGGAGATTWDAGVAPSWLNNGTNSPFADGDTVRFDIGGDNSTTVALNGPLQPGAVTVYSPKNYTFDGTNGSLGGAMKLVKAGAGTLTVSGNHSFSGKTTVWDGGLYVNGDLQTSPLTVWGGTWGGALSAGAKGGRIGGSGRFSQPVALKYRAAITPGAGMGNAGTLTLGSGLTAEDGSVFALDLSNDPGGLTTPSDRIAVTGNLVLTGKVAIVVKALNGQLVPGTYTLVTYTGTLTGSLANLTVTMPVGTPYTLAVGSGAITLTVPVTPAPGAIVWRGSGAAWDLAASQNWLRAGVPGVFVASDAVTFDSTGVAATTATLSTALPVASVTVNATNNYTFNGTGSISGTGGLTKSGSGTLTIATTNDFTGATTINGGVLAIDNLANAGSPSSIGAASASAANLVINGATLRLTGAQTNTDRGATLGTGGATIDVASGSSSIQISGGVVGSGTLTKSGPGTLLLAATNTFSGGTVINSGTIYLAGSNANRNALGSGSVTINNGALTMADVQNNDNTYWNLIVPTGATARLNADGRCSLHGSLTGGGVFTFYTGYIRTDVSGNWSAFSGQINVLTDGDGGDFRATNSTGFPNAALNLGPEVNGQYNITGSATIDIGELSGSTTSSLSGGISNNTVTWRIGGKNTDSTYSGVIINGSGPTAITKLGTGTLTLAPSTNYSVATVTVLGSTTATFVSPANTAGLRAFMPIIGTGIAPGTSIAAVVDAQTLTLSKPATASGSATLAYFETSTYTGVTTVSAGTLVVNTVITGSALTVSSGATLGGTGTLRGNVTVNTGGTLAFNFSNGIVTGLNFLGNLTLNGTIYIRPNILSGSLSNGTFTIANYAATFTGNPTFILVPPAGSLMRATFDTSTAGVIKATFTDTAPNLTWTGATSNAWDTSTLNWQDSGNSAQYSDSSNLTFNDSATSPTVVINGPWTPGTITFNNSVLNYVVSGAGSIGGSKNLTKSGTGTVTLSSRSTYTGATIINDGTLKILGAAPSHRWSFNNSLNDSVGTQNASIVEVGANNATLGTNSITMVGGTRTASDYISLGSNLLPNDTTPVTLEFWATQNAVQNWGRIFDFGSTTADNFYMSWTMSSTLATDRVKWWGSTVSAVDNSNQPYTLGAEFHIALVLEPGAGAGGTTRATWYRALSNTSTLGAARGTFNSTNTLANLNDTNCWLGRSEFPSDSTASATYNEVRVWNRALSAADLQTLHTNGSETLMNGCLPAATAVSLTSGTAKLDNQSSSMQAIGSLTGVAGTEVKLTTGGLSTGSDNLSTTFAGILSGPYGFTKLGSGNMILSGASTYAGTTTISGGTLVLAGSITNTSTAEIAPAATLNLSGGTLSMASVHIALGGTLAGCGTLNAALVNDGIVTSSCGIPGGLTVSGNITNNGSMQFTAGTGFQSSGTFTNNGILDLLTGFQSLPSNFINNGIVIDSSTLGMCSASKSANVVTVKVPTHSGHSYQMQRSASMSAGSWVNVGTPQTGLTTATGAPTDRTFTDSSASDPKCFYRFVVTP